MKLPKLPYVIGLPDDVWAQRVTWFVLVLYTGLFVAIALDISGVF